MELQVWEGCSLDLSRRFADEASGKLANRWINEGEKLTIVRYFAGFSWNTEAMSAVGPGKPSEILRRTVKNTHSMAFARALKVR